MADSDLITRGQLTTLLAAIASSVAAVPGSELGYTYVSATEPVSPSDGQTWLDETNIKAWKWDDAGLGDGFQWFEIELLGISGSQQAKLDTIETGANVSPSKAFIFSAGTISNTNIIIEGQGPSSNQTLRVSHVSKTGTPTVLFEATVTQTVGDIIPCPTFIGGAQAVAAPDRDGSGSITAADYIAAEVIAGPAQPAPTISLA